MEKHGAAKLLDRSAICDSWFIAINYLHGRVHWMATNNSLGCWGVECCDGAGRGVRLLLDALCSVVQYFGWLSLWL